MGYWSTHPMGGDAPLDFKDKLDYMLFSEEEIDQDLYFDNEIYKQRLMIKLQEATQINFTRESNHYDFSTAIIEHVESGMSVFGLGMTPYIEDASFALPFTIVELGILIEDEVLSRKIKNMIKDGGAISREYEIPVKGTKNYPTSENNWNELQSPFDYAIQLYELWDDLMRGERSFDEIEEDQGLFAALGEKTQPGLINKK